MSDRFMVRDFGNSTPALALGRAIAAELSQSTRDPLPVVWGDLLLKLEAVAEAAHGAPASGHRDRQPMAEHQIPTGA